MWRGFTTLQVGREQGRGGRKEMVCGCVRGGIAGRAKIVPKLCDLCCPAKHSHPSHRKWLQLRGWGERNKCRCRL